MALVAELKKRECGRLILWDVKQSVLDQYKILSDTTCMVVDLSKRENIYAALKSLGVIPDFVFNVAGVVIGNYIGDNSDDADRLTMDVNCMAHIWMTKALLPEFEKRGSGHFVNVSSMAAFVGTAGMVVYAASKFAARGFAEALNNELRHRNSNVKVTCVCPSHFQTKLFDGFSVVGNVMMTPEYVAFRTVEGACAERQLVCLPQYLIPTIPLMGLWQANGYLNMPSPDGSNPMKNWGGKDHASDIFRAMGAKL